VKGCPLLGRGRQKEKWSNLSRETLTPLDAGGDEGGSVWKGYRGVKGGAKGRREFLKKKRERAKSFANEACFGTGGGGGYLPSCRFNFKKKRRKGGQTTMGKSNMSWKGRKAQKIKLKNGSHGERGTRWRAF